MADNDAIRAAYKKAVDWWGTLSLEDENSRLANFAIKFAHNSGRIENPEIAYDDVCSIFENGRVADYTGTLLTLVEIGNMRNGWGSAPTTTTAGRRASAPARSRPSSTPWA